MNIEGWAEIVVTIGLAVGLGWPLGIYMARVWQGERTWLDPVLAPVERAYNALMGLKPEKGQGWLAYTLSLLAFSAASFVVLYAILRLQAHLPLNPQGFAGMTPELAFNTAISFVTNTNWQFYSGESAASHLAQMAGFTVQNFASAAAGIAVAAALARAFAANRGETLGNFWTDLFRISFYILLPLAVGVGLCLAALGAPQTLLAHVDAHTIEGAKQSIALGPVASQEAIKMLGTNGGGFFNANSAHPFENPNPLSNLIEMVSMNVLGFACVVAFGRVTGLRREARALVIVMALMVTAAAGAIYWAETQPTPALLAAHVEHVPNMEGKEVRFGAAATAVFAAMTTGASCGAINGWHESFTPIGGGVAMFMIQLAEMLPGGVGSGLYGMIVMALVAVFVAGLMVGRTPEYLGKKIEAREMKLSMLAVLILTVSILGFAAVAAVLPVALKTVSASGPHGLSEILYAYTSATGNNGSAFGGLGANTWWNVTMAVAMWLGRFGYVVPVLAIAGGLVVKPKLEPTAGTLPTHGTLFVSLLIGVILILGGLQYFPAQAARADRRAALADAYRAVAGQCAASQIGGSIPQFRQRRSAGRCARGTAAGARRARLATLDGVRRRLHPGRGGHRHRLRPRPLFDWGRSRHDFPGRCPDQRPGFWTSPGLVGVGVGHPLLQLLLSRAAVLPQDRPRGRCLHLHDLLGRGRRIGLAHRPGARSGAAVVAAGRGGDSASGGQPQAFGRRQPGGDGAGAGRTGVSGGGWPSRGAAAQGPGPGAGGRFARVGHSHDGRDGGRPLGMGAGRGGGGGNGDPSPARVDL